MAGEDPDEMMESGRRVWESGERLTDLAEIGLRSEQPGVCGDDQQ